MAKIEIKVKGLIGDDEKVAFALWDFAGEIALAVGLSRKEQDGTIDDGNPVYANEWGQEAIYNLLCEKVKRR